MMQNQCHVGPVVLEIKMMPAITVHWIPDASGHVHWISMLPCILVSPFFIVLLVNMSTCYFSQESLASSAPLSKTEMR